MAQQTPSPLTVGMLLFPGFTLLDLTGPHEVFKRLPRTRVHLVASQLQPIPTDTGVLLTPDTVFENAPSFDILFAPGGPGQQGVMEDEAFLRFLRERGQTARFITSVCTGSLVLGAAGLLKGYRATTHWRYLDLLGLLGAEPVAERVVIDRNRITGAGVSAGIDFAFVIASLVFGEQVAQAVQLLIEYDPQPPFQGGSPRSSDPALISKTSASLDTLYEERRKQIQRITAQS